MKGEKESFKKVPEVKGGKATLGRLTLSKVEDIETNVSNLEAGVFMLETLISVSSKFTHSLILELSSQFKKLQRDRKNHV